MASQVTSDEKLMAALAYWGTFVLWFLPALILYLVKKEDSSFIRKHALQSLALNAVTFVVVGIGLSIVGAIFSCIPVLGFIVAWFIVLIQVLAGLAVFIYFVILGVQVFQGQDPEIPILSGYLQKHLPES